MLIFGHIGITLGATALLNGALIKSRTFPTRIDELRGQPPLSPEKPSHQNRSSVTSSWLNSLADHIDIRLLVIGSLLPDIIDKPVGRFFFAETFSNGRIFCHTLLFLIVLVVGGLYLYWHRKKTWLLVLAFGTFMHLILDGMWRTPRTLLWPLYGLQFVQFEKVCLISWLRGTIYAFLDNPIIGIPEMAGAVIVIWFVWLLVHRGKLYAFIRNGQA